jgi:mono/diheme cytochrome c family protein
MGLGAATLALAVLAFIAWISYLVTRRPARRRSEPAPPNLEPYLTDDDLEATRLNSVLGAALVTTALLAVVMPIYYLNEGNRQEAAEHFFAEIALERGHEWWEEFACADCHGSDGGGGAATFIEARSGISTVWQAPSLNDILLRYEPEEARHWIVFGRPGTPMPAWGVEGGGPLSPQQVDELLAYITSIQISQTDAFAQVEGRVSRELARIDAGDERVDQAIADQVAEIAALEAAPDQFAAVSDFPAELRTLLTADGTCTAASAALYRTTCGSPGIDSDRDGLADAAEAGLNALIERMLELAPPSEATAGLERISFDPQNAFTNSDGARRIPDLEEAEEVIAEFTQIVRDLRLATENLDLLLETARRGLDFLLEAREERLYAFDFDAIAVAAFDGDVDDARRAAALFNAYCAVCHTAGFSAGPAFTKEAGSGSFGPSLRGGRSVVQFPDAADHLAFIIGGSEENVPYGVNGIGRGWMPGFGTVLSEHDLMLIVTFERTLP